MNWPVVPVRVTDVLAVVLVIISLYIGFPHKFDHTHVKVRTVQACTLLSAVDQALTDRASQEVLPPGEDVKLALQFPQLNQLHDQE